MTPRDQAFVERLAWLAVHGVNIYQFLGEEHIDDANRFAHEKPPKRKPGPPRGPKRRRRSRGVVKYSGPGFDKA